MISTSMMLNSSKYTGKLFNIKHFSHVEFNINDGEVGYYFATGRNSPSCQAYCTGSKYSGPNWRTNSRSNSATLTRSISGTFHSSQSVGAKGLFAPPRLRFSSHMAAVIRRLFSLAFRLFQSKPFMLPPMVVSCWARCPPRRAPSRFQCWCYVSLSPLRLARRRSAYLPPSHQHERRC